MKVDVVAPKERNQVVIAVELLEALNQAAGGMEQMAVHRRDPRFFLMRDGLAAVKAICIQTLPRSIMIGERNKKTIVGV